MKAAIIALLSVTTITFVNSIDFNFNQINLEQYTFNPFRVLGIAPWSSNHDIKKKYNELVRKVHPDRNKSPNAAEQFRVLQKAYEEIKTKRGIKGDNEGSTQIKGFYACLKETLNEILKIEGIFICLYLLFLVVYKFNQCLLVPIIVGTVSYNFIEGMFPYVFDSKGESAGVAIIVAVMFYLVRMCCKCCCCAIKGNAHKKQKIN
jgi:hypothetical protein